MQRLARRAPTEDVRAILAAIEALAGDPRPPGSVALEATGGLRRLRVRAYRVVYSVEDSGELVVITRVARRSEGTYRGL